MSDKAVPTLFFLCRNQNQPILPRLGITGIKTDQCYIDMTESKSYVLPKDTMLRGKNGSYKILTKLGEGGAGITYLAEKDNSGEKVAIKEFFMKDRSGRNGTTVTNSSTDGNFEKYRAKHINEAKKLMSLEGKHNIVKVSDLFEANNTAYYVMEYIEGCNLHEYIERKGKLNADEATYLIHQVGDSVAYMHSQKMLHLDIKPKNVMVRDNGTPVLIDFGLSKVYDEKGEPETTTSILGYSDGFSPTEQSDYRDGKGFPVTMDIYALGATLFNMVVGIKPPSASDVMNQRDVFLDELKNSDVPPKIASCIDKAMAAVMKNRYQSVEAFMKALPKPKQPKKKASDDVIIIDTSDNQDSAKDVTVIDTDTDINSIIDKARKVKIRFIDGSPTYIFTISSTRSTLTITDTTNNNTTLDENIDSKEFSDFKKYVLPELELSLTEKRNRLGNRMLNFYNQQGRIFATANAALRGEKILDLIDSFCPSFGELKKQLEEEKESKEESEEKDSFGFTFFMSSIFLGASLFSFYIENNQWWGYASLCFVVFLFAKYFYKKIL